MIQIQGVLNFKSFMVFPHKTITRIELGRMFSQRESDENAEGVK